MRTHKHNKESVLLKAVLVGVIALLIFIMGATVGFHFGAESRPDRRFTPYVIAPRYPSPSPAFLQ